MRVPGWSQFIKWAQVLALLLAGAIIGAAIFMSIYHHNFNELFIANHKLQEENDKLKEEINTINKFKDEETVIRQITIEIESNPAKPLDILIESRLKEQVMKDLAVFQGQIIDKVIDYSALVRYMLYRKIYPNIQNKDFTIEVRMISIVQNELKLWIYAEEYVR